MGGGGRARERREAEDLTCETEAQKKRLWEEPINEKATLFEVDASENLFTAYADLCK